MLLYPTAPVIPGPVVGIVWTEPHRSSSNNAVLCMYNMIIAVSLPPSIDVLQCQEFLELYCLLYRVSSNCPNRVRTSMDLCIITGKLTLLQEQVLVRWYMMSAGKVHRGPAFATHLLCGILLYRYSVALSANSDRWHMPCVHQYSMKKIFYCDCHHKRRDTHLDTLRYFELRQAAQHAPHLRSSGCPTPGVGAE